MLSITTRKTDKIKGLIIFNLITQSFPDVVSIRVEHMKGQKNEEIIQPTLNYLAAHYHKTKSH